MAPDRPDRNALPDWDEDGVFPAPPPLSEEEEAARDAQAEADVAAGRVVSHEKVGAWLATWGTSESKPYPPEWFA